MSSLEQKNKYQKLKKNKRSNLIYDSRHNFYEYYNNKLLNNSRSSLESKYPFLLSFYSDLNKFNNLNPQKESTKERKVSVYDNASQLYSECLGVCFDQYMTLSDAKKRKLDNKYEHKNLFVKGYDYSVWSEESTDKEESTVIPPMPPLEGDEKEVKEGKGLKVLTPNKLLTRVPILLAQIKAGNNAYQL